jgi:pimeloyl-ACP methyl ester carboxylesterase
VDVENNGRLSRTGEFRTQVSDLEALLTHHLAEARRAWALAEDAVVDVAVYAHGGLTGEGAAARTAARWIPALYDHHVFPIFLMWETSLFDTLKTRLEDTLRSLVRPAGGWSERIRDEAQRWWDARLEKALAAPGSIIWDEMKENADCISKNRRGGGQELYRVNARVKALTPDRARVHLIGHSAGAIALSLMASRLAAAGWRFESLVFLAPAVTVSAFDTTVLPFIRSGRVRQYHQFHLSDDAESRDPTCRPILGYGRSLLYLVSESFEHGAQTAVLGMERYAAAWKAGHNLEGVKLWTAPGPASGSSTHGGFDDDEQTLRTVVRLLKSGAGTPPAASGRRPRPRRR